MITPITHKHVDEAFKPVYAGDIFTTARGEFKSLYMDMQEIIELRPELAEKVVKLNREYFTKLYTLLCHEETNH